METTLSTTGDTGFRLSIMAISRNRGRCQLKTSTTGISTVDRLQDYTGDVAATKWDVHENIRAFIERQQGRNSILMFQYQFFIIIHFLKE